MKGWLLSADPVRGKPEVRLWIKTGTGIRCIRKEFRPVWYVRARDGDYRDLRLKLREVEDCSFGMTEMKLFAGGERKKRLMKVTMDTCSSSIPRVDSLEAFLGIERYDFYNVDIDAARQYMVANRLFPFARVELRGNRLEAVDNPYSLHYPIPELRTIHLSVRVRSNDAFPSLSDPLEQVILEERHIVHRDGRTEGLEMTGRGAGGKDAVNGPDRAGHRKALNTGEGVGPTGVTRDVEDSLDEHGKPRRKVIRGDEKKILSRLQWEVRNADMIITNGGDSFDLPCLHTRAMKNDVSFSLGREGHRISGKRGSYFSYGRILYRPDFWLLKGRFHLDVTNAFLYAEGGIEGCIDLSRMSCISFQTLTRVSPGTAINAMEVHWALRNGYPIPFRKNIPESPKTLKQLVKADRGGHIFNPVVGLHQEVVELDFFSMFPMIMVRYNISPETLNCGCCRKGERIEIPALTYHFCGKRTGMIPQVI